MFPRPPALRGALVVAVDDGEHTLEQGLGPVLTTVAAEGNPLCANVDSWAVLLLEPPMH